MDLEQKALLEGKNMESTLDYLCNRNVSICVSQC